VVFVVSPVLKRRETLYYCAPDNLRLPKKDYVMIFDKIGVQVPRILLPKEGTDMQKWSVIACDQYTSDQSYWRRIEEQTIDSPSTLNLIFPEVYLNDSDADQRIDRINRYMEHYLADGSLVEQAPGFVLVDRKTCEAESRKGLILALDLELYDYNKGAQSLIRTTEGTILDRLPPRVKVRENAPIEVPHIMVLIDDPGRTVIEPLFDEQLETLYDFDLLENGGHLKGYRIDQPRLINQVANAIEKLADPAAYQPGTRSKTPSCSTPWETAITPLPPPRQSGRS
jgi:hypothetical protein